MGKKCEFEKKLKDLLTPAQEKAARILDKDLEIHACAGSGKTRTVTMRIINLIAHGVKPENIVAITFTRKAAAEMKARIYKAGEEYLGNTQGFAAMYIGTIDAFCLKMLQEYDMTYARCTVLDEVQTRIFMERYHRRENDPVGLGGSVIDKAGNLYGKYAKKLDYHISLMSILNNSYFDKTYRRNWTEDMAKRLQAYNSCLREHDYFDFSMIIREMIEYLDPDSERNGGTLSENAQKIFERVKYLTIDEYQDSNPPQEYLAWLFHEYGKTNLCVVGDADQTIYQFRGSDDSNIRGFQEKYNAVKISLDENFRSTEAVIDIANISIANNHLNDPSFGATKRGTYKGTKLAYEKGDVCRLEFDDYDQETEYIVERIKALSEIGIPYSEMAVLFRVREKKYFGNTITDLQMELAKKLDREHIRYIVEGMNNLSKTVEYKAAATLFCYIKSEIFERKTEERFSFSNKKSDATEDELREAWQALGRKAVAGYDAALRELKEKKLKDKKFGHEFNMQQIFQDFISHMAFLEQEGDEAETILYNLGKFSKVIADFELLFFTESPDYKAEHFIAHLENVAEGLYAEGKQDNTYICTDAVRLMTIHQSKGLEFTAVFIPALTNDMFSGNSFFRKPGKIYGAIDALEEMSDSDAFCIPNQSEYAKGEASERNVFYVAVTRAKKYLFLSYANTYGNYYDYRYEEEMPIREVPSPYWEEIEDCSYLIGDKNYRHITAKHLPPMNSDPVPMVLNFSLLSNYFECPYRFKLSNFYGFVQPYKENQGYGKVLHEIMMRVHKAWIEKRQVTDQEIDCMAEEAMNLPFANEVHRQNALKGAKACAHAYVEQNQKDADKMIASEMDINIEMGNGVSVNGRIDLVRKIDEKGKEQIAIVDLKSAGKDPEECLNAEQLKIYALGYLQASGQPADYLMIYNLDVPDGSKNAKEAVAEDAVIEVQKKIRDAAENIRSSRLPRKAKAGKACKDCYLADLCRKRR